MDEVSRHRCRGHGSETMPFTDFTHDRRSTKHQTQTQREEDYRGWSFRQGERKRRISRVQRLHVNRSKREKKSFVIPF
jgi:hypothetical protein